MDDLSIVLFCIQFWCWILFPWYKNAISILDSLAGSLRLASHLDKLTGKLSICLYLYSCRHHTVSMLVINQNETTTQLTWVLRTQLSPHQTAQLRNWNASWKCSARWASSPSTDSCEFRSTKCHSTNRPHPYRSSSRSLQRGLSSTCFGTRQRNDLSVQLEVYSQS